MRMECVGDLLGYEGWGLYLGEEGLAVIQVAADLLTMDGLRIGDGAFSE